MNEVERREFVRELLRIAQLARQNVLRGRDVDEAYEAEYGRLPTEDEAHAYMRKLYPFLFGELSIIPALDLLADREEPPTGQEVYNLLVILERKDRNRSLEFAYEMYTQRPRRWPRLDVRMCLEGL